MIVSFFAGKIQAFFLSWKKPVSLIINITLLLVAVGYGILFGQIANQLKFTPNPPVTAEEFLNYLLILLFIFSMITMILPSYKQMRQFFPKYYPLTTFRKYSFSVAADFISAFFLYILLFLFTTFLTLVSYKTELLLSGLVVLVVAELFKRMLQYCIDFKLNVYGYFIPAFIISIMVLIVYTNPELLFYNDVKGIVLIVLLLAAGFVLESMTIESRQRGVSTKSRKGSIYWKLLIGNKRARMLLIIGSVVKLAIFIVSLFFLIYKNTNLFDNQIILWLFVTPTVLFTYVFNNIWGFWTGLWLNYELRSGKYSDMLKISLKIMAVPLIIDSLLSVPVVCYISGNTTFTLALYFTSTLFLIPLSFFISLFPVLIKKTFTMKGNTSQLGSFAAVAAVMILVTIKFDEWLYLLVPIYLEVGIILYIVSSRLYSKKKYILVEKLLK